MREKHVLIAGVLLLCLVTYYLIWERGSSCPTTKGEKYHPIYFLDPRDVKKLQVITSDGRALVCQQAEGGWDVLQGEKPADWVEKINDFVGNLVMTVAIDRFSVDESQLSAYGLTTPRFRITVTDVTDKTYLLLVGDYNPGRTSVYAKFADSSQVMIVGSLLTWELQKISGLFAPGQKFSPNTTLSFRLRPRADC